MAAFIAEEEERLPRVGRTFRDHFHPMDSLSDEELSKKYQFSRRGVMRIVDLIGDELEHATDGNYALSTV